MLITSCQVSLKPNSGPLISHATISSTAAVNVAGRPLKRAVTFANLAYQALCFMSSLHIGDDRSGGRYAASRSASERMPATSGHALRNGSVESGCRTW